MIVKELNIEPYTKSLKDVGVFLDNLEFKKVKEALISISKRPGNTYSDGDDIYKRPITSSRALQILMKIEECRWDEDIITVAKQIKAGDMLSPHW